MLLATDTEAFQVLLWWQIFAELGEVFGAMKRSTHKFSEYPEREALHQMLRILAQSTPQSLVGESSAI